MKTLLYCTKAKPRLVYRQWTSTLNQIGIDNSSLKDEEDE